MAGGYNAEIYQRDVMRLLIVRQRQKQQIKVCTKMQCSSNSLSFYLIRKTSQSILHVFHSIIFFFRNGPLLCPLLKPHYIEIQPPLVDFPLTTILLITATTRRDCKSPTEAAFLQGSTIDLHTSRAGAIRHLPVHGPSVPQATTDEILSYVSFIRNEINVMYLQTCIKLPKIHM